MYFKSNNFKNTEDRTVIMTVSNETSRTSAVGAAAVLAIPYSFSTVASGDLLVIERVISTGVETELTENASSDGYTATYSSTGGTVTTSDSIASTSQVHVIHAGPRTQTLDLTQGGSFNAENLEAAFDKAMRLINENRDRIDRLIRFPQTDPSAGVAEMDNSIDRVGKFLAFDSVTGAPTVASAIDTSTVTVTPFAETFLDDADADAVRNTIGGSAQFESDFYADFATAISTIGASIGELHIRTEQTVTTNVTVPDTLTLIFHDGGSLSISTNQAVKMKIVKFIVMGRFSCNEYQGINCTTIEFEITNKVLKESTRIITA